MQTKGLVSWEAHKVTWARKLPETARNRKKREAVGGFENEGEDGGMKRKSDEATYACPQEVRAVVPQQMCCDTWRDYIWSPLCLILSLDIREPFVPHVTGIADYFDILLMLHNMIWRCHHRYRCHHCHRSLSQSDIMPVLLHSYKWITPCCRLLHPRFFHPSTTIQLLFFDNFLQSFPLSCRPATMYILVCPCRHVIDEMTTYSCIAPDSIRRRPSPVPSFSIHPLREQVSDRGNNLDIAELGVPS